jgi:hypothetical protein
VDVVLDLLQEGVGQPRELPHLHPHGQVLALVTPESFVAK